MTTTVYPGRPRKIVQPRVSRSAATLIAADRDAGLRFSEWAVVAALGWAYLFSLSTPVFGVQLQISFLKHVPLVMLVPALTLHLLGLSLFGAARRSDPPLPPVMGVLWPLLALAMFVTAGSLVAKYVYRVDETFLTFGLYLFLLPLLVIVPTRPGASRSWMKVLCGVWLMAGLVGLVGQIARVPTTNLIHEIEYLVLSAFFLLWFLARGFLMKTVAVLLVVAVAAMNHKLTGYILASAGLLYLMVAAGWRRTDTRWRGFYASVSTLSVIAVVAAMLLGYFQFRSVLPSGSPEVRLNQYAQAWQQFVNSPIWGTAYLEGSGEGFREGLRLYNIPTHSDLLDHLKHGGLIGFGLFVLGYVKIFFTIVRAALASRGAHLEHAYFSATALFQVGALVTFALNPLLLKGPYLIVILGTLGLATGLALVQARSRGAGRLT